jgi:4-amino-4-deoxy-L-arabinose transferase-like glycosyltransferase
MNRPTKTVKVFNKKNDLLILFLAGFSLRLILVLTARGIATDGCSYLWLAKDILKGDFQSGINAFLPPLFPILSAAASLIFRNLELSARLVSCLLGSLTVFPLFFLVKDIFNRKVAVVTVILFIIHPYLLQASAEVLTEATYFFLITSLAWILWRAMKNKKAGSFFLVGLLSLLITLARPEGIAIIVLVMGWIWLPNLSRIKNEFRWKFAATFFCLVTYILISFPFYLHFRKETGSWKPTLRYVAFIDDKGANESWPALTARILKRQLRFNVPDLFSAVPKAYYPAFLILLFFGLIKRQSFKGFRAGEGYILSFVLFRIFIITAFAGVTDRYFYAFVPISLCWAGVGFWEINDRLLHRPKTKVYQIAGEKISIISVIILLVIGAFCLPKGLQPIRAHRANQKTVGLWLKENAGKKEFKVAGNKPQEAFYAGADFYRLKPGTYQEIMNQIKTAGADFLIVDKDMNDVCPEFKDHSKESDLEVFSTVFEKGSKGVIIYKVIR